MVAESITELINNALENKVFPGGVLIASKRGDIVVGEAFGRTDYGSGKSVRLDTVYDLASLTKPLATSLAVIHLIDRAELAPGRQVGELLPAFRETEKAAITVENLLAHRSGLPDYRPYFRELCGQTAVERDAELVEKLLAEPLVSPAGGNTVYSDPGFMLLRRMVEEAAGSKLDKLVEGEIYRAMGIGDLFFLRAESLRAGHEFAPTEICPWRKRLVCAEVHDENAFAVGGVDGHAGLFGTAAAVHTLLWDLACAYSGNASSKVLSGGGVRAFLNFNPGGERALGFDRPSREGSASGRYFSDNSVGHLGFTGTSFWMDLDRQIIIVLLTNRVHPTRENQKIKIFRPQIHDAVMETVL
ncbi:MAG: beta-lactamase family protein [Deltaproteobacteria bacterium]|nr:beta-lactamase family protein [Deltaproteobacteria bacterium]